MNNLQQIIKQKGYKIKTIAEHCGVERRIMSTLIKEPKNIKGSVAKKLCSFLKVDYNSIFSTGISEIFEGFLQFYFSRGLENNEVLTEEFRKILKDKELKEFNYWHEEQTGSNIM